MHRDGLLQEGYFECNILKRGRKTYPDGHIEEGEFNIAGEDIDEHELIQLLLRP